MGDSFKVVAVLQKRKGRPIMEYSFVPHKWEKHGVLFWPKNNMGALRKDAASTPGKNWIEYKCKVKKNNIFGVEEAQLWEEEYVNASSTEAEDSLKIRKVLKENTNTPRTEIDGMFAAFKNNEPTSSQLTCWKSNSPASPTAHNELSSVSPGSDKTLGEDIHEVVIVNEPTSLNAQDTFIEYGVVLEDGIIVPNYSDGSVATNTSAITLKNSEQNLLLFKQISEIREQLNHIAECQKKIEVHQQKINQRLSSDFLELRANNDQMYSMMKDIKSVILGQDLGCKTEKKPEGANKYKERFSFPLDKVQDVYNFNKELSNNEEYKNYLISVYSSIGGTEGNEDGKIVAKKLLSIVFTKHVLTLFSWTGISRTSGIEKKEPFQSCDGILSFFQSVVLMSDSRWNQNKNEHFFKINTLKHAKQLNEAFENKKKGRKLDMQEITVFDSGSNDMCKNDRSTLTKGSINPEVNESEQGVGNTSTDNIVEI